MVLTTAFCTVRQAVPRFCRQGDSLREEPILGSLDLNIQYRIADLLHCTGLPLYPDDLPLLPFD